MSPLHAFEFMDQDWVPKSLRATLREILECGNAAPFRPYYQWVADEVFQAACDGQFEQIVELGAGTAPITRLLATMPWESPVKLIPCDLNPDVSAYRALEAAHTHCVCPRYDKVDFSRPQPWGPRTLLFLSATFHHIPPEERARVLSSLNDSASRVMIFEPLRKTVASGLFVIPSLVPAILLPLWFLGRAGRLRRLFWCWLIPLAPLMFLWDGWISCVRQWSRTQWQKAFEQAGTKEREPSVTDTLFCQKVLW